MLIKHIWKKPPLSFQRIDIEAPDGFFFFLQKYNDANKPLLPWLPRKKGHNLINEFTKNYLRNPLSCRFKGIDYVLKLETDFRLLLSIECLFFLCHQFYNTPKLCRQNEYRPLFYNGWFDLKDEQCKWHWAGKTCLRFVSVVFWQFYRFFPPVFLNIIFLRTWRAYVHDCVYTCFPYFGAWIFNL